MRGFTHIVYMTNPIQHMHTMLNNASYHAAQWRGGDGRNVAIIITPPTIITHSVSREIPVLVLELTL